MQPLKSSQVSELVALLKQLKASGLVDTYRPYSPKPPKANSQQGDDCPAGYRPYKAPKPNAVTVAKHDPAIDGGAVDAELAAAGWRPYRDPHKEHNSRR